MTCRLTRPEPPLVRGTSSSRVLVTINADLATDDISAGPVVTTRQGRRNPTALLRRRFMPARHYRARQLRMTVAGRGVGSATGTIARKRWGRRRLDERHRRRCRRARGRGDRDSCGRRAHHQRRHGPRPHPSAARRWRIPGRGAAINSHTSPMSRTRLRASFSRQPPISRRQDARHGRQAGSLVSTDAMTSRPCRRRTTGDQSASRTAQRRTPRCRYGGPWVSHAPAPAPCRRRYRESCRRRSSPAS